jgi:hypothetical protein
VPDSWVQIAHACDPHYSEGKDKENHGSKPTWANSKLDPILEISNTKKGWNRKLM